MLHIAHRVAKAAAWFRGALREGSIRRRVANASIAQKFGDFAAVIDTSETKAMTPKGHAHRRHFLCLRVLSRQTFASKAARGEQAGAWDREEKGVKRRQERKIGRRRRTGGGRRRNGQEEMQEEWRRNGGGKK
eukprot:2922603-Rhodomonas_salina.1